MGRGATPTRDPPPGRCCPREGHADPPLGPRWRGLRLPGAPGLGARAGVLGVRLPREGVDRRGSGLRETPTRSAHSLGSPTGGCGSPAPAFHAPSEGLPAGGRGAHRVRAPDRAAPARGSRATWPLAAPPSPSARQASALGVAEPSRRAWDPTLCRASSAATERGTGVAPQPGRREAGFAVAVVPAGPSGEQPGRSGAQTSGLGPSCALGTSQAAVLGRALLRAACTPLCCTPAPRSRCRPSCPSPGRGPLRALSLSCFGFREHPKPGP